MDRQSVSRRVSSLGVRAASVLDLLAVGLSRRPEDADAAEGTSRRLLTRFGSLHGLAGAAADDLTQECGLEPYEVLRVQALLELGRRIRNAGKGDPDQIDSPEDVMRLLDDLRFEKREHFVALLLDAKGALIRRATVHVGTLTMSVVGAREVFREAIRDGASAIVVAHNHPSGDPTPSPEDIEVTHRLVEVGKMLDIPLLDHIVVGERRWVSLREKGCFEP
jgi:DNA repair protein RadC